jgi:hypothetical protein
VLLRFVLSSILTARGESTMGRVPSAAGADTRQRDAGDAGTSSRSDNAADAPASPPPRALISSPKPHARGLLYFDHGLLRVQRLEDIFRRSSMSSNANKNDKTRRAFFSDVTATTALAALAIAQVGSSNGALAQERKQPLENLPLPMQPVQW